MLKGSWVFFVFVAREMSNFVKTREKKRRRKKKKKKKKKKISKKLN